MYFRFDNSYRCHRLSAIYTSATTILMVQVFSDNGCAKLFNVLIYEIHYFLNKVHYF